MSGIIKKIFKLVAYLLLVLIVFTAGVTAIFVATFDANDYKEDLQALVQRETGRNLEFFGEVELTIYPALGMKLGALSLSNAEGFAAKSMIKVNHASISVDVASLLVMNPEVDQLVLRDLEINLAKNKAGRTNWDDLLKSNQQNSNQSSEQKSSNEAGNATPMNLGGAFGGLNIENAKLHWKDDQSGVEYRVKDLDLNSGRITPDAAFPLKMHIALQSGSDIDLEVNLNSSIQLLAEQNKLKLTDLDIELNGTGKAMPFEPLQLEIKSEQLDVDLNSNRINLQGLMLSLNDLVMTGQVDVVDYSKPSINFKLAADTLDIDSLLGTPAAGDQTAGPQPATDSAAVAEDVEIKLPMELLRSLQVEGELKVGLLKLQNLSMQQMMIGIRANNGIIDLKPLKMSLYDGSFDGSVQIDAKGRVPQYQVRKTFQGVMIGKLLTDFTGKDKITGALDSTVSVNTSGEWLSALKQNSNGDLSLQFSDGAIKGFNLRYLIDKAKAKIRGETPPDPATQKTDFSSLSLSGKINRGVFSSEDLDLQAPLLRLGGAGKADLYNNTMDYLLNAKLVKTLKGQQGGAPDQLDGLLIPVRISGPFDQPKIDIQLDEMLKAQSNAQIAAEKAKLQAEIDRRKAELEAARQREKEKQKAVLDAKKEAAKQKAKDKLKKLLD